MSVLNKLTQDIVHGLAGAVLQIMVASPAGLNPVRLAWGSRKPQG